jgi:hypothetical protein
MAKKVNVSKINNDNEMIKLIELVIIVSLIVLVFYVITLFVNKKEDSDEQTTTTPAEIQYDNILVGNILSQPNDKYYVLVRLSDDVNTNTYEVYLSNYEYMTDSLRTYYVDLNNPLNSKFLKEESNFKIKNITDISFKETTLLLIENKKIKKTYEGKDEIINILKEITKTDED